MAAEEVGNDVQRPLSTEKHDIERVEQVSDYSPTPEVLQNSEGEAVAITWKTWAVIFVSPNPSSVLFFFFSGTFSQSNGV